MTMPNPPSDVHELLGAYALDALDERERAAVEELLETDAAARREVDDLREAAAMLALTHAVPEPVPPTLWARIESELGLRARTETDATPDSDADAEAATPTTPTTSSTPTTPTNVVPIGAPRGTRRTWSYRVIGIAAAIALVVGLGAGFALHRTGRTSSTSSLDAAYAATKRNGEELALVAPHAPSKPFARVAWNAATGTGFVRNDGMPALPDGKVYQLWVIAKGARAPLSLGVLGRDATGISPFHWTGPTTAFAMSVEDAPGASTPSVVVASTA
jgi:anti-sigma-K factor RskA